MTKEDAEHPGQTLHRLVINTLQGAGIPLVQFRTVQLGDGQLQLQKRRACMYQAPTSSDPGAVQICRLNAEGTGKADPVVTHNSMQLSQIQRVLHEIETATLQRALAEKTPAGETSVNAEECFSFVYMNQYVDFEIMATSVLRARDLKRWLVHRCILESMGSPMPPPRLKSSNPIRVRGARGASLKAAETTKANEKDDVAINVGVVGEGCFVPSYELGALPAPFLSVTSLHAAAATQAAEKMGQPPAPEGRPASSGHLPSGAFVDVGACLKAFAQVPTSPFPATAVGSVTCHGCEPAPFSKTNCVTPKTNQDAGCVVWPVSGNASCFLVAVMDGHGELGHRTSRYCLRRMVEEVCGTADFKTAPGPTLEKAFLRANDLVASKHSDWGTDGGTTATAMLVQGGKCTLANCGDSRIVLATRNKEGSKGPLKGALVAVDLTTDHTPLLPGERQRIEKAGGWVAQDDEEAEARVWLDRDMTCGLAMSRSLGDLAFKNKGVIAKPEISEHVIVEGRDEFFLACSDGVFGVMSSQEAVDVVAQHKARRGGDLNALLAAQEIIVEAARRWKDEEGDYRDDITAIVVALPLPIKPTPPPSRKPSASPRTSGARATSGVASSPGSRKSPKPPPSRKTQGEQAARQGSDSSSVDEQGEPRKGAGLRRIISIKENDSEAPAGIKM